MRRLKLCYPTPDYRSHRRVAKVYQEILSQTHELIPMRRYEEADVVILHREPHDYAAVYRDFPALSRKHVVSCCVWETSELPDAYKRSLERVQEVWTCSRYCQQVFGRCHPCVQYVPHAIERDLACSQADLDHVKRAIAYEPDKRYYVTIARGWGGRKNVNGLVRAFERLRHQMPDARLVLKVEGHNPPRGLADPRIVWVAEDWTDSQINALYRLSHVYVSPHYAEGWGLTMSDAMLFGKPVIATGYSGNLEFMRPDNSWLLACEETEIREEDQYALFRRPMKWAYPDDRDLEQQLCWMYGALGGDLVNARVRRASADLRRFDRHAIGQLMNARLATVEDHV